MRPRSPSKDALRRHALSRRDSLPLERRIEASLALLRHAARLEVATGDVVSGYWPIRSEIDPRPLMQALRQAGARLCLPVVDGEGLIFRALEKTTPLQPSGFGTHSPGPEAEMLAPDLILVPLAGFDRRLHRIGYGRGYYDQTITKLRQSGRTPRLVGLAFALQEVDAVPEEPHDVSLDRVLTEQDMFEAERR